MKFATVKIKLVLISQFNLNLSGVKVNKIFINTVFFFFSISIQQELYTGYVLLHLVNVYC